MSVGVLDHIGLVNDSFPVSWAGWFAQSIGQQGFGSNDFKAKAPALPDQQLNLPVEALRIASRVAVSKVVKDGIAIVLYCQREWQEGFSDIRCDLCEPGEVARERLLLCGGIVDAVEQF